MYKLNLPKKVYFKAGSYTVALRELSEVYGLKRAFFVTDEGLFVSGVATPVIRWVEKQGLRTAEYFSIRDTASFEDLRKALPSILAFDADVIVGVGGGCAMSAAKALWALYENPELDLAAAVQDPSLIRTGAKAKLALVATSFGSGAQNTPYAVLRDDAGQLVELHSEALLPIISCTDADFTATMTAEQVHAAGRKLLVQGLHALVAENCCEYPAGLLDEAVGAVLQNLGNAEKGCSVARERLHNAGALMGIGCANVDLPALSQRLVPVPASRLVENERIGRLAHKWGYADAAALVKACEAIYA